MHQKYPSTPHLPWSPSVKNDDTVIETLTGLEGQEIIVTEKMDGENTTLYRDGFHARSLDSRHHPSRDWVAGFHASLAYLIPEGWRVCGENLYAKHSIHYQELPSYFLGFSVWNERNVCLSWDVTLSFFREYNIEPVPEIYRGIFSLKELMNLWIDTSHREGFVVRVTDEITFADFPYKFAKWVRKGHVQTDAHWMHTAIVPNKLR